jgi:predicted TIM-barrel fold metal-dependent hydrolase
MHGWPEGKVADGGSIVKLMRKYPNLYGDLSAFSGYNALARDPEFAYKFMEEFKDRLLYGTDISAPYHIDRPMIKLAAFLDEAVTAGKISYDAYLRISRDNALEILM